MKALAILDTDSIKKYVFGTNKLKEIRGASALLDDLNRRCIPEKLEKNKDIKIIYSNGGTTLFTGPVSEVKVLLKEGERTFKEKTITGSATGCSIECSEEDLKNKFKELKLTLNKKLSLEKDGKRSFIPSFTSPYVKFCDSCSTHPSSTQYPDDNSFLCDSCLNKRKMDKELREEIHKEKIKGLWGDFLKKYGNRNTEQPEDLSQIGETARPKNYIALIYCDGNCMGKAIEKLRHMEEYGKFSHELDNTLREETYSALDKFFGDDRKITVKGKERKIYPFDFLLLGGDDLLIVTAADKALDVTLEIMKRFEKKLCEENLTLSAGVVIAHAKYPIFNLLDLAEQLLKSAKIKNYELRMGCNEKTKNFSTIDFMVVSSSNSLSVEDIRTYELTFGKNDEKFSLCNRPYTIEDVNKLRRYALKLKKVDFPKTKLNFMVEALFSTKNRSMLDTITVIGRLKEEQKRVLMGFFRDFSVDFIPWKKNKDNIYITPLLDLLEIYDFVSESPGDDHV
jgi:CRISPR/Cas system-associated protein Cas10 (large subunit of type III CRISPR-Cas system)